jgi:hypothetical protein
VKVRLFFNVLVHEQVGEAAFVNHWAAEYRDKRPQLYRRNIGKKKLTQKRIWELFEWKNGGPIAKHKRVSIQRNYVDRRPAVPKSDRDSLVRFICQPGGAIWRIFWLHCRAPNLYPIFDQHVYRAMRRLQGLSDEIPQNTLEKARAYVDEYLPFHRRLKTRNKRKLDNALWVYGKYMKGRT